MEVHAMNVELGVPLLTAEEVGRILRLRPATVYEAAADGRIPCIRLWKGRRKALVRFRRDQILNLINGIPPGGKE
jgi:hypothetical protein